MKEVHSSNFSSPTDDADDFLEEGAIIVVRFG